MSPVEWRRVVDGYPASALTSKQVAAANAAYYDSGERHQLSPDPAIHIVSIDERSAHRVL